MLTPEQKQTFFDKGYLILPRLIAGAAAGFEGFVWECLGQLHGIRRDEPQTWNVENPWFGMKHFKEADVLQGIGSPQLCEAIDDLLGPGTWDKPRHWGGFLVNFPDTEPSNWHIPNDGWHVDYHYTYAPEPLFGLRVFTFLSEVEPRGAATLVVSGSHRFVERFTSRLTAEERALKYAHLRKRFNKSNPWLRRLTQEDEHAPGRNEALMEEDTEIDGVAVRVEQFVGRPGDIVLMHPWLLHTRAPHGGTKPRFMLAKSIYTHAAQMHETAVMVAP